MYFDSTNIKVRPFLWAVGMRGFDAFYVQRLFLRVFWGWYIMCSNRYIFFLEQRPSVSFSQVINKGSALLDLTLIFPWYSAVPCFGRIILWPIQSPFLTALRLDYAFGCSVDVFPVASLDECDKFCVFSLPSLNWKVFLINTGQ